MKDINPSEIERVIDNQLATMYAVAPMFGSPEAIEGQCWICLHLIETFCVENPRDLVQELQKFRKEVYPKCPGPMPLHVWLTDEKYGMGMEWNEASHKVVDFFIQLRKRMKLGNS